ncbi:MAG: esterase/lipase family protein [Gammaproteobacteria bacterium]
MRDYWDKRARAIRVAYGCQIQQALRSFDPDRRTVILIPGGMASQLDRSHRPYTEMHGPWRGSPVWMSRETITRRNARLIMMQADGRDADDHIIVPNRELRYGIKAYAGMDRFFSGAGDGGYNYLVFGYDWRRPFAESADWLHHYLVTLRRAVRRRFGAVSDPLARTTLVCHSQGGLIAKTFLERFRGTGEALDWMEQVVTVGTGFYGVTNHQARYFAGIPPLNVFYGSRTVARIVASTPAPYALMPLSYPVFERYHEQLGLGRDEYPVVDAYSGQPMDPYSRRAEHRYPQWMNLEYLSRARGVLEMIARPLQRDVARRFFNIRSLCNPATTTRQTWTARPERSVGLMRRWLGSSPLGVLSTGGGDGHVPHWSGFHASTPPGNRAELTQVDKHHEIARHPEALRIVEAIIETGRVPARPLPGRGSASEGSGAVPQPGVS